MLACGGNWNSSRADPRYATPYTSANFATAKRSNCGKSVFQPGYKSLQPLNSGRILARMGNANSVVTTVHHADQVAFHRTELAPILSVYGRMVAAGEWRDYGMSNLRDVAIFSVFRRTAEHPIYRIEKRPKLASKQGMYSVIGMDGRILKRGHDLKSVLRVLEKKLIRVVD